MSEKIIDKTEQLLINRKKTLKIMRGILYILPILGITNNIYIYLYGDYDFNYKTCLENISIQSFTALGICSLIYIASYNAEKYVFPLLLAFFVKSFTHEEFQEPKTRANKYLKTKMNINYSDILQVIREFDKVDLFSLLMFAPVTFILWMIYINSLLSYLAIIVLIIMIIPLIKVLTNFYDESNTTP